MKSEIPPLRVPRRMFEFTELLAMGRSPHITNANTASLGSLWSLKGPHLQEKGMLADKWGSLNVSLLSNRMVSSGTII